MDTTPKISVIIAIYKVAAYLEQCLASVAAQSYRNLEIILVIGMEDGTCPDECLSICERFAAADPRFVLLPIPVAGIADARNKGLAAATGDLIGFVDGDDYADPDMFSSMEKNLREGNCDIAVCGRFYEFQNTTLSDAPASPRRMRGQQALETVLTDGGFFLHCWDKLYRRRLWEGITFPVDCYVEDRVVVNRLLGKAESVVYDSTPRYHFRERSGSLSKAAGMARNNDLANRALEEYVRTEFPALSEVCGQFMIRETITSIQNLYLGGNYDRQEMEGYRQRLRELQRREAGNPLIGGKLKLKIFLTLYLPGLLSCFTRLRKGKTDSALVRFA